MDTSDITNDPEEFLEFVIENLPILDLVQLTDLAYVLREQIELEKDRR